ncbi:MAG: rRNA maturation RNase YbeY [Deltaproteobacteria bacterium]|nr:rRNA maturation RNase YbeY [Deltaproteobacteria bacterium]
MPKSAPSRSSRATRVQILDEQDLIDLPIPVIRRMAANVMKACGRSGWELSIVFVDDARIREWNRQWLGKNRATNVLSMSQQESADPEAPTTNHRVLGDVVVSVETCARNAAKAGMTPIEEIAFCLIHGICHLLGYDHEGVDARRAAEMATAEKDLYVRFARDIFPA